MISRIRLHEVAVVARRHNINEERSQDPYNDVVMAAIARSDSPIRCCDFQKRDAAAVNGGALYFANNKSLKRDAISDLTAPRCFCRRREPLPIPRTTF